MSRLRGAPVERALPRHLRFYPPQVPSFPGEPTRLDFEIRFVDGTQGEGVVSLRAFAPGQRVFLFTGEVTRVMTQYSLQLSSGLHVHDPYLMGKVLHHCEPNCHVDVAGRIFTAIRPIKPGDFVTMDYCQTEDVLFRPFECQCDAPSCRGFIGGRLAPPPATG
jgi:hypothetical protein